MKSGQRSWKSKQACASVLAALAILLFGAFARSEAQEESTPASQAVWHHVGRVYLNPNTGNAVYAGYLVHLNGISSSLFNGSPSEASAYLTFSTDVLQLTPMPKNGDIALSLVSAGTFNVYYNTTPNGDWSNPATFSSGQLIATFARKESLFPEIGTMGFHSLSESLLSSRSFKFDGQTFNFNRIAPHGITSAQFFSTTLLPESRTIQLLLPAPAPQWQFAGAGLLRGQRRAMKRGKTETATCQEMR